mmetsp:Transcript_19749/g.47703  ORF Transcript_19749/g.47703 Transcript_19749/m.47703 type:complete len:492 (-) Transcript_19749:2188-3663(-)
MPSDEQKQNQIVDHPYLQSTYPDRPRTLSDILRYEEIFTRTFFFKDLHADSGRFRSLTVDRRQSGRDRSGRDESPLFDLPGNIAVLDQLENLTLKNCRSIPESIKYLKGLKLLTFFGSPDTLVMPPAGCLKSLTRLERLELNNCGSVFSQFMDLPNVKDLKVYSRGESPAIHRDIVTTLTNNLHASTATAAPAATTQSSTTGSTSTTPRLCNFATSLKTITFDFYQTFDRTVVEMVEIVALLLQTFPNLRTIRLSRGIITPSFLDLLTNRLLRVKEQRPEIFPLCLKCLLPLLPLGLTLTSIDALENVLKLLDVLEKLDTIGPCRMEYVPPPKEDNQAAEAVGPRPDVVSAATKTTVQVPQEYEVMKLKLLSTVNKRRARVDLALRDKAKLPLPMWTNVIGRMDKCKLLVCTTELFVRDSKELKEWQASYVYAVLRHGLVSNDVWREQLISSSTTTPPAATTAARKGDGTSRNNGQAKSSFEPRTKKPRTD